MIERLPNNECSLTSHGHDGGLQPISAVLDGHQQDDPVGGSAPAR